ncbi:MAG: hypothetical protein HY661_02440 [Betaproteobacteria bacterium]|nr:hypothetical protein [Betaproteobacteria bacterium]
MSDLLPDLSASETQLKRDLLPFFAKLESRMIPDAVIESVHSSGYAEDGTFLVMLDCVGGATMFISAEAGKPLRVMVQPIA